MSNNLYYKDPDHGRVEESASWSAGPRGDNSQETRLYCGPPPLHVIIIINLTTTLSLNQAQCWEIQ